MARFYKVRDIEGERETREAFQIKPLKTPRAKSLKRVGFSAFDIDSDFPPSHFARTNMTPEQMILSIQTDANLETVFTLINRALDNPEVLLPHTQIYKYLATDAGQAVAPINRTSSFDGKLVFLKRGCDAIKLKYGLPQTLTDKVKPHTAQEMAEYFGMPKKQATYTTLYTSIHRTLDLIKDYIKANISTADLELVLDTIPKLPRRLTFYEQHHKVASHPPMPAQDIKITLPGRNDRIRPLFKFEVTKLGREQTNPDPSIGERVQVLILSYTQNSVDHIVAQLKLSKERVQEIIQEFNEQGFDSLKVVPSMPIPKEPKVFTLDEALATLLPREKLIVEMHIGIRQPTHTYAEIAQSQQIIFLSKGEIVSKTRIGQIYTNAMKKLEKLGFDKDKISKEKPF